MGFLSKKSMLVSLLALSLAACTSTPIPPIPAATPITLPCNGDAGTHPVATTITFTGSPCDLQDVDFIQDQHGNHRHFAKHKSATSVVFKYDGQPILGDGAYFYYITKSTNSPNPDGGGGGIIKK
jgi:hypothetical protein